MRSIPNPPKKKKGKIKQPSESCFPQSSGQFEDQNTPAIQSQTPPLEGSWGFLGKVNK